MPSTPSSTLELVPSSASPVKKAIKKAAKKPIAKKAPKAGLAKTTVKPKKSAKPAPKSPTAPKLARLFLDTQKSGLVWHEIGLIAGVDEAGRGPLAGNVVAAAVILDDANPIKGLADSKKLSAIKRGKLFDEIYAKALCVGVGQASVAEIDKLNILQATLLAMQRAIKGLRLSPKLVLVDGNRLPMLGNMRAEAIVKGDAKVCEIAAASIIAKVTRDRQCDALHTQYPQYGFDGHKGYGTAVHMAALRAHGACPEHRASYAPVREAIRAAIEAAAHKASA